MGQKPSKKGHFYPFFDPIFSWSNPAWAFIKHGPKNGSKSVFSHFFWTVFWSKIENSGFFWSLLSKSIFSIFCIGQPASEKWLFGVLTKTVGTYPRKITFFDKSPRMRLELSKKRGSKNDPIFGQFFGPFFDHFFWTPKTSFFTVIF